MSFKLRFFFTATLLCLVVFTKAQKPAPVKVAVMAPLYLDSAFSDYSYQLGDKNMPQQIITGLDFYNGVMLAVDSLQKEKANIEIWVYDTKKKNTDINGILKGMAYQHFAMIIGSFNAVAEQKAVSDFSFSHNIPVISATYPNDAGLNANPYFVVLNATLTAHISGIYNYIQQNYSSAKPVFITRTGVMENKIAADFKASDSVARYRSKYRVVNLPTDFSISNLKPYLDSTKQNVLVCGSLNTVFAKDIARLLCNNPQYKTTLIGMPNWDGIKGLTDECESVEVVYSTPFNYSRTDSVGYPIVAAYKDKYFARPSDMVFKGYEAMYHFTNLLLTYKNELIGHLSDNRFKIANNFNIQPVTLSPDSALPDYQENKNLYFIKKLNGAIVSVSR